MRERLGTTEGIIGTRFTVREQSGYPQRKFKVIGLFVEDGEVFGYDVQPLGNMLGINQPFPENTTMVLSARKEYEEVIVNTP
ncbi:hypothetical protein ISS85_01800 [Candidatus Microgenomates bacterium]|nr:hypothetical protein [Candidatus Microgenomates bacterium]